MSVIGFDNIPESALTDPPLTTIDQSIQTMGEEAVRLLVDLLNGVTDRPLQITLPTKLVERQSCRRSANDRERRGRRSPTLLPRPGVPIAERSPTCSAHAGVEELAQLGSAWVFQLADRASLDVAKALVLRHGIGQVTRISGRAAWRHVTRRAGQRIQRHLVTEARLGIPAIVHEEICSGLMARDSTIFPQAIGVASTWQPELAAALADAVRVQMRAMGAHQGSRRCSTSVAIRGGDVPRRRSARIPTSLPAWVSRSSAVCRATTSRGVIATAKHFVGYGASEG